ncbi:MAG TPA: fibronectin type III domain-containing protein [Solirubrobacteraceae bacterium]|nr:fibronectin type III domain-containing protein [Solirubrobacteraceae bacterium]
MPASRMSAPDRHGRRRFSKRVAAVVAGGVLAAAGTTGAFVASAAVPTFPDNLVVFPDRDFITVEGYQDRIGQTATIEVSRDGKVIGSAQSPVAAGDVAFEINHPGGVCWGNGTDLNVTPDIRPGDKVAIKFDGEVVGDTVVQDTYVSADSKLEGSTLTITGHVGPGVNPAQMEQRIVNPDLTETNIGRRDVRATPSTVLTPSDKGGYSSMLAVDQAAGTFTATYVFDDPAVAQIAASGGGERAMAWQQEDAEANRQGLTISEYKEVGGPGMSGCPAGPGDASAPAPGKAAVVRSEDKTSVQVTWTPVEAVPTADPVSGYSVVAIANTASSTTGDQVVLGRRTGASATRATITDLDPNESYKVEVRSIAGAKMSEAFGANVPSTPPAGDTEAPTLTASPAPDGDTAVPAKAVTLSVAEGDSADIYYTTDGSAVIGGDLLPTDKANLYTGPIPITAENTVVKAVAIDAAGNATPLLTGKYSPAAADPVPAAPVDLTGTVGQGSVALKWTAPEASITGYSIQVYESDAATATPVSTKEVPGTSTTITGLSEKPYWFTIKAANSSGYGQESAKVGPLTPTAITDRITISSARWKTGEFRVSGTGSVSGAVVTVWYAKSDGSGPDKTRASIASGTVVAGAYDIRLRDGAAPRTNPGRIFVESNNGGLAGPFTVANG